MTKCFDRAFLPWWRVSRNFVCCPHCCFQSDSAPCSRLSSFRFFCTSYLFLSSRGWPALYIFFESLPLSGSSPFFSGRDGANMVRYRALLCLSVYFPSAESIRVFRRDPPSRSRFLSTLFLSLALFQVPPPKPSRDYFFCEPLCDDYSRCVREWSLVVMFRLYGLLFARQVPLRVPPLSLFFMPHASFPPGSGACPLTLEKCFVSQTLRISSRPLIPLRTPLSRYHFFSVFFSSRDDLARHDSDFSSRYL